MRLTAAIFLFICLMSFKKDKSSNRDFKVIKAEKQTVFGGAVGSPVVTVYTIKLKARRKLNFEADSAWADGRMDVFSIAIDSFNVSDKKVLKKGEIITIHLEIKTESEIGGGNYQTKIPGSIEKKAPIDYKMGALLRYGGGKCKYLIVNEIEAKESVFMP